MNTVSWKITALTLIACPIIADAQAPVMPLKYQNASPEIRAAAGYPTEPAEQSTAIDPSLLRAFVGRDPPSCAGVKVSAPVSFHNRTLVEIPDIHEPNLRLANQLMSAGCFALALDKLEAVTHADPANRNAQYIIARMTWMRLDTYQAERMLQQTLARNPDFISAKVLLAGIRFEQEKIEEVERLVNEAEPKSPTDLWIYMNRLRIESLKSPTRELRARLLEIVRSTAFPPNAREQAAEIAKLLPQQSYTEYEEILWARLDIDSSVGMPCKAAELARWIGEVQGRYPDVIKLLESPRAKAGNCNGLEANRMMLAQAYLMEAAKISAGPSPANQALLDRADRVVNGDYTSLAQYVIGRPQAAKLQPFLAAYVHPDEEDSYGVTLICRAIDQLNADAVRDQLEAGANPNGRCGDESLVGSLVFMATTEKADQRRDVMRTLLEHGAPVTDMDSCRSKDNGNCSTVLLPIMEKFYKPTVAPR